MPQARRCGKSLHIGQLAPLVFYANCKGVKVGKTGSQLREVNQKTVGNTEQYVTPMRCVGAKDLEKIQRQLNIAIEIDA
jgi:hypothetical protein